MAITTAIVQRCTTSESTSCRPRRSSELTIPSRTMTSVSGRRLTWMTTSSQSVSVRLAMRLSRPKTINWTISATASQNRNVPTADPSGPASGSSAGGSGTSQIQI